MTTLAPAPVAASSAKRHYIVEIQGLRTVAALMVATYHIWFGRVSGGVDVFFVVSAFFMTSALLRIAGAPRTRAALSELIAYLANVLRRVVPSAVIVIAATIGLTILLLPSSTWTSQMKHALASTLFAENLWLAREQTDYLAQGAPPSPFQQFWALGLQMQFYVFWPLVALAAFGVARLMGGYFRRVVGFAVGVIAAASFAHALVRVESDQSVAYFLPTTRAWEFAAGIALALATARLARRSGGDLPRRPGAFGPPWLGRAVGWTSFAVLLCFAAVLDASTMFPGVAALVPVAAASGVVLAAATGTAPALLRAKPLVGLAPFSFAFYLWHWPLLIVARNWLDVQRMTVAAGLAIIAVAWCLAWATTRFFENPVRNSARLKSSPWMSFVVCGSLLAALVAGVFAWHEIDARAVAAQRAVASQLQDHMLVESQENGEASLALAIDLGEFGAPSSHLVPAARIASTSLPPGYTDGCAGGPNDVRARVCTYGDVDSPIRVALVGGSRSLHWLPALARAGAAQGFAVDAITRTGCVFGDTSVEPQGTETCQRWQESAMALLLERRPDAVVMLATRAVQGGEKLPQAYPIAMERLQKAGVPVVAIRDIPRFDDNIPACVENNPRDLAACSALRSEKLDDSLDLHAALPAGVQFVDATDLFCDAKRCYGTRGDLVMYRDHSHVTTTYALAIAPRLLEAVQAALAAPAN